MLDDADAVRGVGELQAQNARVILGLLQSVPWILVDALGFDDGDRKIALVPQQIIGPFLRTAADLAAGHDEQETLVMQRRGQTVRRALERVMADPRYGQLDDAGRARVIKRLLPRVRAQASMGLRRELERGAR